MQTYDMLMLLVLVSTTIFGAIKGFAWQVASLASIVASYFVAYYFRNDMAKVINAQYPWNLFLAMLVLYGGSSFFIWMIFRLISTTIDKVRLKEFDRHMGALFGFGKGVAYCLLITMFAMALLSAEKQRAICSSRSGFFMSKVLASADGLLPKEVDAIVGPHLDSLEKKLESGRDGSFAAPAAPGGWNVGLPNWPANPSTNTTGQGWSLGQGLPSGLPTTLPGSQGIPGGQGIPTGQGWPSSQGWPNNQGNTGNQGWPGSQGIPGVPGGFTGQSNPNGSANGSQKGGLDLGGIASGILNSITGGGGTNAPTGNLQPPNSLGGSGGTGFPSTGIPSNGSPFEPAPNPFQSQMRQRTR